MTLKKNHLSQIFQCRSCCVILVMLEKLGYSSLPVRSNQIYGLVFNGNSGWRCDWVQVRMGVRFLLLPVVSPDPYFPTSTCTFPTCPNRASHLCQLLCLSPFICPMFWIHVDFWELSHPPSFQVLFFNFLHYRWAIFMIAVLPIEEVAKDSRLQIRFFSNFEFFLLVCFLICPPRL